MWVLQRDRSSFQSRQFTRSKYDETLQVLRKSFDLQGANPCDLAVAAMAHGRLQRTGKGQQVLQQARAMLADPKWSKQEHIQALIREAEELLQPVSSGEQSKPGS